MVKRDSAIDKFRQSEKRKSVLLDGKWIQMMPLMAIISKLKINKFCNVNRYK